MHPHFLHSLRLWRPHTEGASLAVGLLYDPMDLRGHDTLGGLGQSPSKCRGLRFRNLLLGTSHGTDHGGELRAYKA